MFETCGNLILASQSPRRRELLARLGLRFSVRPAGIDESRRAGENPRHYVERLAAEKAAVVRAEAPADSWIVAADTEVLLDGAVLGKPSSTEQASAMILGLAGREHLVRTGYCVCDQAGTVNLVDSAETRVRFMPFGPELATAYATSGEGLDKAGGYGIQGQGAMLVEEIVGSYSNVVGLPLSELISILLKYGVIQPFPGEFGLAGKVEKR